MKQLRIISLFCCLLAVVSQSHAFAPIIDDSENFAVMDDDLQADFNTPADRAVENIALAHDDALTNNHKNLGQKNLKLLGQIQELQREVQELRGQLEVQTHELAVVKEQQLAFYKDLDSRLQPTNARIATKTSDAPVQTNPVDEEIGYMAAYDLIKHKQFINAIIAMQTFIDKYPHSGYIANAQYWLGELHLARKNYAESIQHFEIVLKDYPKSGKAAASHLKIGYAMAASGKTDVAKNILQQVIKDYPDTTTAKLAQVKLNTI
ncbi:MAG: tol-pal system protein YbgF [Legionellales bacterium RIFCSPHIGHO2_12_FULL_42_9]|nr:MAG: tol-pal system protein YbgF [Legionellales bacterium RIFCSPHIGHO2_12_FULL_42_9]